MGTFPDCVTGVSVEDTDDGAAVGTIVATVGTADGILLGTAIGGEVGVLEGTTCRTGVKLGTPTGVNVEDTGVIIDDGATVGDDTGVLLGIATGTAGNIGETDGTGATDGEGPLGFEQLGGC